jgi:hypothetical protein
MTTFPDTARIMATMDQHRPLDPQNKEPNI